MAGVVVAADAEGVMSTSTVLPEAKPPTVRGAEVVRAGAVGSRRGILSEPDPEAGLRAVRRGEVVNRLVLEPCWVSVWKDGNRAKEAPKSVSASSRERRV